MKDVISVNEYRVPAENKKYPNRSTLLMLAVKNKNVNAVEKLLKKYKANPNRTDDAGNVPLVFAAFIDENYDITKLLLDYGANPMMPISIGIKDSILNWVQRRDTEEIRPLFKQYKQ